MNYEFLYYLSSFFDIMLLQYYANGNTRLYNVFHKCLII